MYITLTDLHVLLKSVQICKKCTFLDNLRTITQEGNMGAKNGMLDGIFDDLT